MSTLLHYQHFYLVGIKGVAMTALAQCLLDAGKTVTGSDVAEQFVTQPILDRCGIQIDESFDTALPLDTECVIYTSAHHSQQNPQVQAALAKKLPIFTHAEALSFFFNHKDGVAVCGVGGKSTTSAMITWVAEKLNRHPSFAVGVGNIPGLEKTGQWQPQTQFFIAEADEYVTDPSAPSRGEEITPRFSFLDPYLTICTHLKHDHPDVYPDFATTRKHFQRFFDHIKPDGLLITNLADRHVIESLKFWSEAKGRRHVWFGQTEYPAPALATDQFLLITSTFSAQDGQTSCTIAIGPTQELITLRLQLPGLYNLENAVAAVAACWRMGISPEEAVSTLFSFRSTQRRSEYIGEKNGVRYYDDYAHHPHEVASVIHAYRQWFPESRLIIGFQSHTFSRTKQFFDEFVEAFAEADEVAMLDIFPSAREAFDSSVTSSQLCVAITQKYPGLKAHNYETLPNLAQHCQATLRPGDVFLSLGAGNIYQVHDFISAGIALNQANNI